MCGHTAGECPSGPGGAAGGLAQTTKELTAISHQDFETTAAEGRAACGGADLVVAGFLAEDLADVLAEANGVPMVTCTACPCDAPAGIRTRS